MPIADSNKLLISKKFSELHLTSIMNDHFQFKKGKTSFLPSWDSMYTMAKYGAVGSRHVEPSGENHYESIHMTYHI